MTKLTPYGDYKNSNGLYFIYAGYIAEQQRLENIKRNRELLEQFNLTEARNALHDTPTLAPTPAPVKHGKPSASLFTRYNSFNPYRPIAKPKNKTIPPPVRKSSRLQGIEPPAIEIDAENSLEIPKPQSEQLVEELWDGKLLKADEYFDEAIRQKAIRTDGNFRGWINPELIEKHQFALSAAEAWEQNGGGKFSYKDPSGTGKKKTGGRSSAKVISQAMFKKNPNMYFYRHNEPGVEQWTGDWTEEEKEIFLKVAREHGCGDKWGIFASYIPHR
ncbi:hypothetical protein EC973_007021 [Apophysomyces ossiformis]|uniref:Myb-like domain-containing protein n=1 Tax=Apophysomyces ossiformis TaxID=679940 RepID=A0A8H7BMP1_9FUNG|nr:hypothetical protein EC973_007021 [Apophysomyces ossiformis]